MAQFQPYPDDVREALFSGVLKFVEAGKPFLTACRLIGVDHHTIDDWVEIHPSFGPRFARAQRIGIDRMIEDCLEIADRPGRLLDAKTKRVMIETRFKIAARLWPEKYGEAVLIRTSSLEAKEAPPTELVIERLRTALGAFLPKPLLPAPEVQDAEFSDCD